MRPGKLLLVGGAEILHRQEIMRSFVELAGGPSGPFLVAPTATSAPVKFTERLRSWLAEVGVDPSRVEVLEVSRHVPGWEAGARDPRQLEKVERAAGLWFLGGDQGAITSAFLEPGGGDSPLLAAIRRRYEAEELAVGGTSAGAAVMSDPMIGGGTSFGALALPRAARGADGELSRELSLLKGFGFFPDGIVDQHFDTRARLGRLLEAAMSEEGPRRLAFGIAEATGLRRVGSEGSLSAVGAGSVILLDARTARRFAVSTRAGPRTRVEGAVLHCMTAGDRFLPDEGGFDFGRKEAIEAGDAALDAEFPEASGVLSPYGDLAGFASRMLLDNDPGRLFLDPRTGLRYVRSLLVEDASLPGGDRAPLGWELRLYRLDPGPGRSGAGASRLHYDGRYSFENVRVDVIPLEIEIRRPD